MTPIATVSDLPQPGRTLVMGVINVTPDSFSDGGRWFSSAKAVRHGRQLIHDGADLLDVGGESTRPGAERPDVPAELGRVLPVITELAATGAVVSVDTMRAEVAAAAVHAGARRVNDVSGGLADPAMLGTVAGLGVPYVCMHWRAHATDMQSRAVYADVVTDVLGELRARTEAALAAGIRADHLVIDPGIGFAKSSQHNWELLRRLDELDVLGLPVLVGASRKSFLGSLLADAAGAARPPAGRDDATTALTALLARRWTWGVRVHAVRASSDAIAVVSGMDGTPRSP